MTLDVEGIVDGSVSRKEALGRSRILEAQPRTFSPANRLIIAFPLGTLDTFVTYGAPANLIETVNTIGLAMYARQLPRPDGSAIEVKTEASILPVNKRPRLAVKIHTSN
jgi:hypothetical protein